MAKTQVGVRKAARRVLHQTLIQRSRAVPPAMKATFHQVVGAGRSHVRRQFFGLSKTDEDAILALIEQRLDEAIRKER